MSKRIQILALLDTMWGHGESGQKAPISFTINPRNASGRCLYKICDFMSDNYRLKVTNCSSVMGGHANEHHPADIKRLKLALEYTPHDFILVCGGVSHKCWKELGEEFTSKIPHALTPHPASRNFPNILKQLIGEQFRRNPLQIFQARPPGEIIVES